ncbi:hypothetical protein [uncultured Gammaproteobacteria bacterium]|jgi:ubiquitin|nr:hypothetical protein [uncultured Gammaproteobacteria bacterium]
MSKQQDTQIKQKVAEIYTFFDKDSKNNQAKEVDLQELKALKSSLKNLNNV